MWRIRYENAAKERAEAEASSQHWQQCALGFAELLQAAGGKVGDIEPLLADTATVNATTAIEAEIGQSYRESVGRVLDYARDELKHKKDPKEVLTSLVTRLDNLTVASAGHRHRTRASIHKKVVSRRAAIRQTLGLPPLPNS
ncbi:hypothetical protein UG54_00220 [Gordonia sihwensis]|nr:hypothetical protein UG54_00220 [Gordonia sihwensis]